jgi:hypothetical protein
MGVMNALIDVNVQLAVNNMTDKTDMNWASVGVSFGTGMLGFGLAQRATQVGTTAWKIAANPLVQRAVDSGIDGAGKIVENQINGKAWNNELAETVAGNFILGSAADLGIKGAGKVWNKYGDSITSVISKDWGRVSQREKLVFLSGADPVAKKYGAAIDNYLTEFEVSHQKLINEGVDFHARKNQFAYSPNSQAGNPGSFIFDLDGSIGALRHEMKHFADDQALGYPGLSHYLQNPELFWRIEYRGYMEEIKFAKSQQDFDLAREILQLMRIRRKEILGK